MPEHHERPSKPPVIIVRDERPEDRDDVRRIVEAAFGRKDEADLIDALRRDGDLDISLVALEGDALVGHVGLSRMRSPADSLGLGPIAVIPERQRSGVGSALINAALEQAMQRDCGIVFVLGEPDYYGRFGFAAEVAADFPCLYSGPYFMALRLSPAAPDAGPAVYAKAFDSLV